MLTVKDLIAKLQTLDPELSWQSWPLRRIFKNGY